MFIKALLVALIVWLGQMDEMTLQFQTTRAIVTGPVVGLVLGDFQTGLQIGAALELMYLSNVIVGAAGIPDVTMAAGVSVALAILGGIPNETAISVGAVVAAFGQFMATIRLSVLGVFFARLADKPAREGDTKKVFAIDIFASCFIHLLLFALPTFIAVYYGTDLVVAAVENMPVKYLTAISKGASLLASIGFGMLLSMLTAKKFFPLVFIGFVLSAFAKISTVGIVIIAVAIAVLYVALTSKEEDEYE